MAHRNKKPILDHKAFIRNKHMKLFNTPRRIIEQAVKKATGSAIKHKERIIKGEANEVYGIETKTGKKVVVRISHRKNPKFAAEKWAITACAKAGVPVPKVLLIDSARTGGKQIAICVESRLPGTPLNELSKTIAESDYLKLVKKSGKVLSKINSIPINGFGELDENGNGKYNSIKEVLLDEYAINEKKLLAAAKKIPLAPAIIKRALKIVKKEAAGYPSVQSRLLHSDFGPKHILVAKKQITGIIDLEDVQGGDPVREFARWDFFYPDSFESMKKGYGDRSVFSKNFEKRFRIWKVYLGLSHIRYYFGEKDQLGMQKSAKKLSDAIKYFE